MSRKERYNRFIAIIPALVLFLAFTYYPLMSTIKYSVTDWNGFSKTFNYVGFENFINLFQDSDIRQSFGNTMYFTIITVIIGTVLQLFLAVVLYNNFKGKKFFRALFYLPCVISQLIASLTWIGFFQYTGVINEVLVKLGFEAIDLLGNPDTVKGVLIFIDLWLGTGYGMVIFLAGLTAIPSDVYESARIDGAIGIRRFFKITLPLLMPSVTVNIFISITACLKVFDMPFIMTRGGPMGASNMLSMTIYDNAFKYEKFGYSAAIGLTFFLFIASITIVQLILTRRKEVEY